jgi:hypothetical protein
VRPARGLTAMTTPDPILRFYRLEGADARGRTLLEIQAWDDERLESVHDYIQWLFPLPEPSAFNPLAPILSPPTARAFRHDPTLQARLAESLTRMLAFYGLMRRSPASGRVEIEPAKDFKVKSRGWLHAGNHNHLRLTRILTSLRLLGLDEQSRALFLCLEQIAGGHPDAISATTLGYWRRAAG